MKKRFSCLLLAICMLAGLCACSGENNEQPNNSQNGVDTPPAVEPNDNEIDLKNLSVDMLKVVGGASGGMYYTLSTAFAQVVEENTNISLQVEATEGGSANVAQVCGNDRFIGMTSTPLVYEGATQTGWAADAAEPYTGIAALFPCYPSAFGCYALASKGYKDIYDLDGATVCLGPAGSSYNWQMKIYESCGIKINPVSLSWADAVNSLKDGSIDACSFSGAHPFASCTEVQLTNEVTFLQISEEDLAKLAEEDPTRPIVSLDAGTYTYMTEDYKTLCEYSFFMCNEDLPDDVAYALTKLAMENADTLNIAVAAAKDINADCLQNITTCKLHPGAYRYYQEMGYTVPEALIPG